MVQTSKSDIVGPSVSTPNPRTDLGKQILSFEDLIHDWESVQLLTSKGDEARDLVELLLAHNGVVLSLDPFVDRLREFHAQQRLVLLIGDELFELQRQIFATGLNGSRHSESILGSIFKQRPAPGGTLTLRVDGQRTEGRSTGPNGRATRRIGNDHSVAKQLSHQLTIGSFSAAFAGARELNHGFLELGSLDRVLVNHVTSIGEICGESPVSALLGNHVGEGRHGQCVVGAGPRAGFATGAILRRDLDTEHHSSNVVATLGNAHVELSRSHIGLELGDEERTNSRMRADHRTLVALRAFVHIHNRNSEGDSSLLVLSSGRGRVTARVKGRDGKSVALQGVERIHDLGAELRSVGVHRFDLLQRRPLGKRDLNLDQVGDSGVNGLQVSLHKFFALGGVGLAH